VLDFLNFCAATMGYGATMHTARRLSLLLDLALLAASLVTGGPVADGIRTIAVLMAAIVGGLVVFCAVVLTIAVVQQRTPPYRI
jgi:hypothetical protein